MKNEVSLSDISPFIRTDRLMSCYTSTNYELLTTN